MVRYPWRFLGFSLAAAWTADFLFWKKPLGISFLIWSMLLILFGVLLSRGEKVRIARRSFLLMAAVLLLSVFVFLRMEPFTQAVSLLFAVLLIFLLAATFLNGHWFYYKAVDYVAAAFQVVVSAFARPFDLSKSGEEAEEAEESQRFGWKKVPGRLVPLLRGLVLALPVVLVLGALLAAADPIFSDWVENTLKIFNLDRFAEYLFRFFYIIVLAYLFTGLYLLAVRPKRAAQQPDPDKPPFAGFLGWTESAVILASVNLLFAVFLVIQFRYFFGGEANIHATGYTYSEYARRGFGELVAVAVLSLLLYLGLGLVARLQQKRAQTGFTLLSVLLVLQVMVILVSAFQRLRLYEDAYGFTRMRTYPHVFMVWLAVLLASVLVLEVLKKRGRFALVALIAAFGFCTSLAVLNVDGLVVRQNVRRAAVSELDSEYLKQLSSDAVPVMVSLFGTARDLVVQDALGAELACRAALLEEETLPWQGFSLSRAVARRTLAGLADELAAYPVRQVDGDWMVSVGDETRNCRWVGPEFID